MPESSMSEGRKIRIAIIGAGVSGLAVANGLLNDPQEKFDVQIYERDSLAFGRERGGYVIGVADNGLRALNSVLDKEIWARLKSLFELNEPGASALVDPSTFTVAAKLRDVKLYPNSRRILRADLREILLERPIGRKCIHFGHQFSNYELQDEGIKIHFKGGSLTEADILIAADGSNSSVNRQIGLNNKKKLSDRFLIQARSFIDHTSYEKLPEALKTNPAILFLGGSNLSGFAFSSEYHGKLSPEDFSGEQTYTLFWATIIPQAIGKRILEQAKDDDKAIIDGLIKFLEEGLKLGSALPTIIRACNDYLRTGPVTSSSAPDINWRAGNSANSRIILIGDAIHPMTPARGMGANQALTDAQHLVELLLNVKLDGNQPINTGDLSSLVSSFDGEMYPRAFDMVKKSESMVAVDLSRNSTWLLCKMFVAAAMASNWALAVMESLGLVKDQTFAFD